MKRTAFNNIIVSAALAAAISPALHADELNQTISLEKETEVVERKADKLASLPEAMPVKVTGTTLDFSNWAVPAALEPSLVTQTPQPYPDGFAFSKKRGYAVFGMGNYLNIEGSAGFRILDREKTGLGVWLQHNSTDGTIGGTEKVVVEDRIGLDLKQIFGKGTLTARAGYHFDKFNYYGSDELSGFRQKVNEAALGVQWEKTASATDALGYHAGIGYNFFGNGKSIPAGRSGLMPLPPLKEHDIRVNAGAEILWGGNSFAGIDAAFRYMNYKENGDAHSVTTLTPYYRKSTEHLNLRVGVRLDLSTQGTAIRIAPDVKLGYTFNPRVAVELAAVGGNRINSLHGVAARNRYLNPAFPLSKTYTLADAEARINIGLWKGFSASPYIGFAVVKGALAPRLEMSAAAAGSHGSVSYAENDLNGIKAGLDLSYRFKALFEIRAGYIYTPQDIDSGYLTGDDRAEHTVKASLKATPLKNLDIYAGYELRSGRNVLTETTHTGMFPIFSEEGLGVVSDLGIGADYRINGWLHVYAQGNNLLNRSWQDYYRMYSQKANFIIGAGITF